MSCDIVREIRVIEANYKGKTLGKFVDMHRARSVLGDMTDKVSYSFYSIDEKRDEKLFWELIRKGFVLEKQKQR